MDIRHGGVGYRNHSLPVGLKHGATWSEDLTWIEPVTECVNTNLSIGFSLSSSGAPVGGYLTDKGGFSNLTKDEPHPGRWGDNQSPDLRARAHRAAWFHNRLNMIYFNLTKNGSRSDGPASINTFIGKKFALEGSSPYPKYLQMELDAIRISSIESHYLGLNSSITRPFSAITNFDNALSQLIEASRSQRELEKGHFDDIGE